MLIKIDDIVLYTAIHDNTALDSIAAKAIMDVRAPDHLYLNYGDPSVLEDAMAPLRTWFFFRDGETKQVDILRFPFVIYTEIHDDFSPSQYPRVILYGLDEIKDSNIGQLYQLGR